MSVAALSTQPSHEIDLDIQRVVLDVVNRKIRGLDTRIDGSIVDGELERTIEGASTLTLTVHDPRRALLQSGMFAYAIDVRLDRLYWRLVKVAKADDELTLTFEDREVAYLRQNTRPRKASRSKVTRAQFALSLVREVKAGGGIPFVCPELRTKQPIAGKRQERTKRSRTVDREKGLASAAHLTVKGKAADAGQRRNAERVLDVADSHGADEKATLALMEAVIVESLIRNLSGGDADSRGILQVRDSTARGMGLDNRDVSACCAAFLQRGFWGKGGAMALAAKHTDWSAGKIAQATQGSAYPSRYDQVQAEAKRFVEQYEGGVETTTVETQRAVALPFQFRRGGTSGERENSWQALQRLAEEVRWRCFMSAGRLYFISETALIKAKPRLVLSEQTPGVNSIDFDVDGGKRAQTATITCRASRWIAAPGAVVQLTDCGPADGRWLVATLNRGLFDAEATITLKRPAQKLPEPAPETAMRTSRRSSTAARGAASRQADRAYSAAQAIHQHHYPYVWGGGHARAGSPSGGGYDCSGSVSAILAAAGMGFERGGPASDSGGLMSWGEAGRGELLTVYANASHVFAVFHDGVGKPGDEHFGTGDWGKGWNGAGLNPRMHPTAGFTARHWAGS